MYFFRKCYSHFTLEFFPLILRTESIEFEVKDSWIDFIQYILGIDKSDDTNKTEDEEPPSFSKVMARVTSSDASTAESDEETESSVVRRSMLSGFIPEWFSKE